MVKIINQLQASNHPLVYIRENTYPGKTVTRSLQEAHDKVVRFLGNLILLDAADMESVAHRVRYYWQNFLDPVVLHEAMPNMMVPPPLFRASFFLITTPVHLDTQTHVPSHLRTWPERSESACQQWSPSSGATPTGNNPMT